MSDARGRLDLPGAAVALGLLALGAVVYGDGLRLGAVDTHSQVGPDVAPRIVGGGLIALAAWTGLAAWRGEAAEREAHDLPPILWIVAGLILQMLLLGPAGFSIATGVMFALAAAGFGNRRLWLTAPAATLASLAVYGVFAELLELRLPPGPLERLLF